MINTDNKISSISPVSYSRKPRPSGFTTATATVFKQVNLRKSFNFPASAMLYIPEYDMMCLGGHNGALSLWKAGTFELVAAYPKFSPGAVTGISYYKKKGLIIVFSSTIQIVKIAQGNQLKCIKTLKSNFSYNTCIGIDEVRGFLITKSSNHQLHFYSLDLFAPRKTILLHSNAEAFGIKSVYAIASSKNLLLRSFGNKLEGYNILSGKQAWVHEIPEGNEITSLHYSANNNTILGLCWDNHVIIGKPQSSSREAFEWSYFKMPELGGLSYVMGTLLEGVVLIQKMNTIFALNITKEKPEVIFSEVISSDLIISLHEEKGKMYMLDWTKAIMKVVLVKGSFNKISPIKMINKLNKWVQSAFKNMIFFSVMPNQSCEIPVS